MNDSVQLNEEIAPPIARWRWIACAALVCLAAAIGLVSHYMGDWPWSFRWLDGKQPDATLMQAVERARVHLSGIGMVGMFTIVWLLLRKRNSWNELNDNVRLEFVDPDEVVQMHRRVLLRLAVHGIDIILPLSDNGGSPNVESDGLDLETESQLIKEQIAQAEKDKTSFLTSVRGELYASMDGVEVKSELVLLGGTPSPINDSATTQEDADEDDYLDDQEFPKAA